MALARRIHVTLFTPLRVADRVKTEIDRNFDASEVEKRKLIRYVMEADLSVFHLCDVTLAYHSVVAIDNVVRIEGNLNAIQQLGAARKKYYTEFVPSYQRLLNEEPIVCAATKLEYPAVAPPKMIVIDVGGAFLALHVRLVTFSVDVVHVRPIGSRHYKHAQQPCQGGRVLLRNGFLWLLLFRPS